MVIGSVCLYLAVRKSSLLKFPTQFNNLAMFLVPLIVYLIVGHVMQVNYLIPLKYFGVLIFAAIFFSYLTGVTSLRSIELAPNPGYSLIISKSYVVFTTLISYLFLNGEISSRKILAIFVIILFSALIIIDPKQTKNVKNKLWAIYALYSFFGWGFLSLIIKYLSTAGISAIVTLTYLDIFVSMSILIESLFKKVKFKLNKQFLFYFLVIGICSSVFNYFNAYAVTIAPNIGYVNAMNASSISLVTIFSVLLFKDEFLWRKLLGVFGVTAGLLLLLL